MSERKFKVILKKLKLAYPEMTGNKALACMLAFDGRFIETVATTSANGIDEVLTLEQMREIFEADDTVLVKVEHLTDEALNWAVAQAAGVEAVIAIPFTDMNPNTSSPEGLFAWNLVNGSGISVESYKDKSNDFRAFDFKNGNAFGGNTPLLAAIRCYVAFKLGDQIDIPVSLLNISEAKTVQNGVFHALFARGWSCYLDQRAIASKSFITKLGYKDAQIYLSSGDGYNQTLSGTYLSEGRNILSGDCVLIPVGSSDDEVAVLTEKFLNQIEVSISQSYTVKLLRNKVLEVSQ